MNPRRASSGSRQPGERSSRPGRRCRPARGPAERVSAAQADREIKIGSDQLSLIDAIRPGAAMPVRRLNHAVLYVNGLDREVDFYTGTLGFEIRMQIPGQAAFLRSPGSANDHDLGLFDIGA